VKSSKQREVNQYFDFSTKIKNGNQKYLIPEIMVQKMPAVQPAFFV